MDKCLKEKSLDEGDVSRKVVLIKSICPEKVS